MAGSGVNFWFQVTDTLQPFGAVHRLYTPNTGTRVKSFSEIKDGQSYVAATKTRFKKLNYASIMVIQYIYITETK